MHQRTGVPLVATNDIHYLMPRGLPAQDVLLCINTGAKRADEKRFRFDTDTLFFRTREEMARAVPRPAAGARATMDVADQVDLRSTFGTYHLPVFDRHGGRLGPDERSVRPPDGRGPDASCYGPDHARGARAPRARERGDPGDGLHVSTS